MGPHPYHGKRENEIGVQQLRLDFFTTYTWTWGAIEQFFTSMSRVNSLKSL